MISQSQWRILVRRQSDLIRKCGDRDGFPDLYYETLNSYVPIDNCVAYIIENDQAEHIFTRGKLSPAVAQSLANSYISLFHKDPAWQELTGISRQKILWHMQGSSYSSLYKYHFFERNKLLDKVARVEKSEHGLCSCYIYRRKPSAPFSTEEIAMLEIIYPFFTSVVVRHCEILALQRRIGILKERLLPQEFRHSIEQVIAERVEPLDTLSRREIEVCEHIFKGLSIHEIAEILKISPNSVATYRQRAYNRLSIGKIQDLFALLFAAVENWRCRDKPSPPPPPESN